MTSNRSYSKVRPQAEVRAEIERCKNSQFDPDIADVMLRMIDEDTDYSMSEQPRDTEAEIGSASSSSASFSEKKAVNDSSDLSDFSENIQKLAEQYDLDIRQGVKNSGGEEEEYIETLAIFAGSIEEKADEIRNFLQKKEYENYIVKVHSLKSPAKIVGANSLSEHARALEFAGKDGDIAKLEADTPALLEEYRSFIPLKELSDATEE